MALSLNKPKLDNLASDIWKSAERLRGKFKAYEYESVILPIIVIRRLECVLIDWREKKAAEVLKNRPKLTEKELAKLVVKGGVKGDHWGGAKRGPVIVIRIRMELFSGEKGLWSVAEEAFLPEARSRGQWLLGGFLLRRLCLSR